MSTAKIDVMMMFTKSLKSPYTKKAYTNELVKYQKYAGVKTPEELLKFKQDSIISYLIKLEDQGKAHSTKQIALAAIRHFYDINDITMNWKKIGKFLGEAKKTVEDRGYNRSEIAKILSKCDERKRVIILTLASTGMRLGGLVGLKLKDLTKTENGIYRVMVYAGSKEKYITFCSLECTQAIDSYLEYRKRYGERLNPDSPLIRNQFDKTKQKEAEKSKPMSTHGLQMVVYFLLLDSGIRQKPLESEAFKRKEIMRVHGFREFFNTELNNAYENKNPMLVELLLGHDTGLPEVYNKVSEKAKEDFYLGGMDSLTIDDTYRLQKQVKILEVKAKAGEKVEALEKIVTDGAMKNDAMLKRLAEQEEKNRDLAETVAMLVEAQKEREELERHKTEITEKIRSEEEN